MKKLLSLLFAIAISITAFADDSCSVYGGTNGNRVKLEKTSVRNTSGWVSVFLSKPEKKTFMLT